MATTVTVRVLNDLLPPSRQAGVLVRVNLADGAFVTDGTTGSNGEVTFVLPAASYDLIFYKAGFSCPVTRLVVEDGAAELWSVAGHVYVPPESADPYLCRVSGFFIGALGHPARDAKLILTPVQEIIAVAGQLMVPASQVQIAPDSSGYLEFDLVRGVHYEVYIFGVETIGGQAPKLDVYAPERASIDLATLLFPVQVGVEFSTDEVDLEVGGPVDDSVSFVTTYSDGNERLLPPAWCSVAPTNSDPTVVEVTMLNGTLVLRPLAAGTATISMQRTLGALLLWRPELPPFTSGSILVTVS